MIGLEQARRDLVLRQDQIDLDIRDELRRLKSTEERIELQKQQIAQEQRAVTVTQIRYESGKLENRDLLEARQALVDAQNALIRLKAEHFVGRLKLLQDLGVFFLGGNGMWL
jgi:outer membrane protein TolC